ncbi:hypothetical protein EDD18DRAFT_1117159 [Armillaria luteobubalina]|uniref:Uncharacterized protein n=1 Tax=Armillaria luteobubalina TaxID=153913 RepID=A0AA39U935_9AGAR|nr:hypothetical protein EDD18DRAFT_1117159 [Armillaria luteobubalina]
MVVMQCYHEIKHGHTEWWLKYGCNGKGMISYEWGAIAEGITLSTVVEVDSASAPSTHRDQHCEGRESGIMAEGTYIVIAYVSRGRHCLSSYRIPNQNWGERDRTRKGSCFLISVTVIIGVNISVANVGDASIGTRKSIMGHGV